MKLPLVLFAIIFSQASNASDWVLVTTAESGSEKVYIDFSSITAIDNLKKFWVKYEYEKLQQDVPNVKSYNVAREYEYLNCAQRKSAVKQQALYLEQNIVYSATEPDGLLFYKYVTPDSIGETIMQVVCEK